MKEPIKQFQQIQTLQLSRLERLADVVYGLILIRLFFIKRDLKVHTNK